MTRPGADRPLPGAVYTRQARGPRLSASNAEPKSTLGDLFTAINELVDAVRVQLERHRPQIEAFFAWVEEHRAEIEAFGRWGALRRACEQTGLYAPPAPAWADIADAAIRGDDTGSLEM